MKKKGNKKMPTPREKVIHNLHPYIVEDLKRCVLIFKGTAVYTVFPVYIYRSHSPVNVHIREDVRLC